MRMSLSKKKVSYFFSSCQEKKMSVIFLPADLKFDLYRAKNRTTAYASVITALWSESQDMNKIIIIICTLNLNKSYVRQHRYPRFPFIRPNNNKKSPYKILIHNKWLLFISYWNGPHLHMAVIVMATEPQLQRKNTTVGRAMWHHSRTLYKESPAVAAQTVSNLWEKRKRFCVLCVVDNFF